MVGAQTHLPICVTPAVSPVQAPVSALAHGVSVIDVVTPGMLLEATVITPAPSVVIDLTYLLGPDVVDSPQPHPLATGSDVGADCTISEIAVRHAPAARTTSVIF